MGQTQTKIGASFSILSKLPHIAQTQIYLTHVELPDQTAILLYLTELSVGHRVLFAMQSLKEDLANILAFALGSEERRIFIFLEVYFLDTFGRPIYQAC